MYHKITEMIHNKLIVSSYAIGFGGICEAVSKMAFGNELGVTIDQNLSKEDLFAKEYGSIIAEVAKEDLDKITAEYTVIGTVTEEAIFNVYGTVISMDETLDQWKERLEGVFPTRSNVENTKLEDKLFDAKKVYYSKE